MFWPTFELRCAELVMFESTMCEWCGIWHEEVGVVCSKTSHGQIAPLRRIDINDEDSRAYHTIKMWGLRRLLF